VWQALQKYQKRIIHTDDIENLTGDICNSLAAGDIVVDDINQVYTVNKCVSTQEYSRLEFIRIAPNDCIEKAIYEAESSSP